MLFYAFAIVLVLFWNAFLPFCLSLFLCFFVSSLPLPCLATYTLHIVTHYTLWHIAHCDYTLWLHILFLSDFLTCLCVLLRRFSFVLYRTLGVVLCRSYVLWQCCLSCFEMPESKAFEVLLCACVYTYMLLCAFTMVSVSFWDALVLSCLVLRCMQQHAAACSSM